MSNLIKVESIPGLSIEEAKALEARNEKRIRSIGEFDMSGPVKEMISNAVFIAGQKPLSPEELTLITMRVIEDLKSEYRQYTLSEVSQAIILGAKEKFGEYANVSVRQIMRWLDAYGTQIKREANNKLRDWEEREEKRKEEAKEEEKIKMFEEFIINAYDEFNIGDGYENAYRVANIYSYLEKKYKIHLALIEEIDLPAIEQRVKDEYYKERQDLPETFAEKAIKKQRGDEWKLYQEAEIKTRVKAEALLAVFTYWKQQNYKLEL